MSNLLPSLVILPQHSFISQMKTYFADKLLHGWVDLSEDEKLTLLKFVQHSSGSVQVIISFVVWVDGTWSVHVIDKVIDTTTRHLFAISTLLHG